MGCGYGERQPQNEPRGTPFSRSKHAWTVPQISKFSGMLIGIHILLALTLTVSSSSSKVCVGQDCGEGRCINGSCACRPGWRGPQCDQCYGRVRLSSGLEGIIHDGPANYSKDLTCSWLIDAGKNNMRITFEINSFATECTWDHLYIHNGDSTFAPLVAAYSGNMGITKVKPRSKFKLSGRYVFIHFYSDAAFTTSGFNISYTLDGCALDCSDKSTCNGSVCECKSGWTGVNCDVKEEGCLFNCSQHGDCEQGKCQCDEGYKGLYCEATDGELYVQAVPQGSFIPSGRASAPLVYDDSNYLWLFGGYTMGAESTEHLFRFNKTWLKVNEAGASPWPRHGHTVVFKDDKFYVFGGVGKSGGTRADLWSFDPASSSWQELKGGPRDLAGHTAHVVDDIMIVIFGYSSVYSYSNKVLEYSFATGLWTIVKTTGSIVYGGYGHSSVYDKQRGKIYVYGGYHSQSFSTYNLTDRLYQYNPISKEWFHLRSSGSPLYLHAAVMWNGVMVTYGGSFSQNDTRTPKQAKCFSSDFMVYDPTCNNWYNVPSSTDLNHVGDIGRVGHSLILVDREIYLFGGFNSGVKNYLFKISAGDCFYYKNQEVCENSLPGMKCIWNNGNCITASSISYSCAKQDGDSACSGFNTCQSCLSSAVSCQWCSDGCVSAGSNSTNCSPGLANCTDLGKVKCRMLQSCRACKESDECHWASDACRLKQESQDETDPHEETCTKKPCSSQSSCINCTKNGCMWCSNLNQCIDTNSYVVHFYYGQCMDWTTKTERCIKSQCSHYKSCSECQAVPKCGWCSDETNTGTGSCHEGSMSGPVSFVQGKHQLNTSVCPSKRWHFNDCPECQCNGHSTCLNGTSTCTSCKHPTTGPQCQFCLDGYHGNPKHGGACEACSCNDQADGCDPVTGDCYCRTRGVVGKNCQSCDDKNKYSGNPKNGGTCFYRLTTDFQYTFNLSKPEDQNHTMINFINTPTSSDHDVDFLLNCSSPALINITYKSKSFPKENEYVSGHLCDYFRTKFEHKSLAFGGKENTTFMVYVYDFKTPFMLQISFVQHEKINLYKFFIIFFSCFLALILLLAAAWKIKHKVESYRRGRRLEVEMQQMARRPFSTIAVEIEKKSNPTVVDKKDHLDSVLRRRKKQIGNKPSSIAIEPLKDNKAAILTVLIQLPTGYSDYAPSGNSGLAVGSALVSLGSNRKQSLEHIRGDKLKVRKNLSYNHPDTCA